MDEIDKICLAVFTISVTLIAAAFVLVARLT